MSKESGRVRERAEEEVFTFATIHPDITPCEDRSVHLPLCNRRLKGEDLPPSGSPAGFDDQMSFASIPDG